MVNSKVFRGGQPTSEGFRSLAAMGVKTIVDLRGSGERSRAENKLVTSLGMQYVNVPMSSIRRPTDDQIAKLLSVFRNSSSAPVFVHCRRGSDRTGAVLAIYRMEYDQWTNQKALEEARTLGMSWYQIPRQRYLADYEPQSNPGDSAARPVETAEPVAAQ